MSVRLSVNDVDAWNSEILVIDKEAVASAIDAELAIEARWRSFVAGRSLSRAERSVLMLRRLVRRLRLLPHFRRSLGPNDRGFRMVRRLANIEMSHLHLMREAAISEAAWVLILEDDAWSSDASAFASELQAFVESCGEQQVPIMVSLSESFTPVELGIQHLLTPATPVSTAHPWRLWASSLPVTNTVCATLYRASFLRSLVEVLDSIPLSPVIPIDFKLNEALMRLAPNLRPGDCWIACPAPLTQRSGVPDVRRPWFQAPKKVEAENGATGPRGSAHG